MFVATPTKTLSAVAAVSRRRRVKLNGATIEHCTGSDKGIGQVENDAAIGEAVAVCLDNAPGTREGVAHDAISAGADVYAAAAGRVASTGTVKVGVALSAATAQDDLIEYLPLVVS